MRKSQFMIVISIFMVMIRSFLASWYCIPPASARAKASTGGPIINDTHLTTQLITSGLKAPSAMAFIGPDDILVTEKNTGNVVRMANGVISQQPLLHVEVSKKDERITGTSYPAE